MRVGTVSGRHSDRVHEFQTAGCTVRVTDRSLADLGEHVDALVSSDDNYLSHGGGVSKALWDAAGPRVVAESLAQGPERWTLGDVVITAAGRLNTDAIFHAVTIDFDLNRRVTQHDLAALYSKVFLVAERRGLSSIGLPLVASGVGRVGPQTSAFCLGRAIQDCLAAPTGIRRVVVSGPKGGYDTVMQAFESLKSWRASFADLRNTAGQIVRSADRSGTAVPAWVTGLDSVLERPSDPSWAPAMATILDDALAWQPADRVSSDVSGQARRLRNRLAHGAGEAVWNAELTGVLLVLLSGFRDRSAPAQVQAALAEVQGPPPDGAPAASTLKPIAVVSIHDAARPEQESSHVRRLHRLLLECLGQNEALKSAVDRLLSGRGYQGDFELRLLEHCIRIEQPSELLTGTFDLLTLQTMYWRVSGQAADVAVSPLELARDILSAVGFPDPAECRGPKQVREFIDRAEQRVRLKGLSVAAAAVQDVARQLEYLCHVLLLFICQAAFGQPPSLHRRRGATSNSRAT